LVDNFERNRRYRALMRLPPARWLIIGGFVAALAFVVAVTVVAISLRPVRSSLASGLIGAAIGGAIWFAFFRWLAARLERRIARSGSDR